MMRWISADLFLILSKFHSRLFGAVVTDPIPRQVGDVLASVDGIDVLRKPVSQVSPLLLGRTGRCGTHALRAQDAASGRCPRSTVRRRCAHYNDVVATPLYADVIRTLMFADAVLPPVYADGVFIPKYADAVLTPADAHWLDCGAGRQPRASGAATAGDVPRGGAGAAAVDPRWRAHCLE
jgi:hypothetical protein